MPKFKDLTVQKFSRLTVVRRLKPSPYPPLTAWIVQCKCGSPEKPVLGQSLRRGVTKSCGCLKRELDLHKNPSIYPNVRSLPHDLRGKKFGRLTPLYIVGHKPVAWECRCDCGKIVNIKAYNLLGKRKDGTMNTQSCGCLRSEVSGNLTRKRPYESLYNGFVASCKREVKISYEEFLTFTQTENCHYCNGTIAWAEFAPGLHGTRSAYYLDRKDNALGYMVTNVVVCCTRCNKIKSNQLTYEEMVKVGKTLHSLRKQKQAAAKAGA